MYTEEVGGTWLDTVTTDEAIITTAAGIITKEPQLPQLTWPQQPSLKQPLGPISNKVSPSCTTVLACRVANGGRKLYVPRLGTAFHRQEI